ncbi:rhodanese-like domain-containing protein [Arcticibacter sp.]
MLKKITSALILTFVLTLPLMAQFNERPQFQSNPWTASQVIDAASLAGWLKNKAVPQPVIFNIGVVDNIKGARLIGGVSDKENLNRFKDALASIPKTATVVVYCGCCPFERRPNIRSAMPALRDAGFKNRKLLDLPTNVKMDWIDKGYPME